MQAVSVLYIYICRHCRAYRSVYWNIIFALKMSYELISDIDTKRNLNPPGASKSQHTMDFFYGLYCLTLTKYTVASTCMIEDEKMFLLRKVREDNFWHCKLLHNRKKTELLYSITQISIILLMLSISTSLINDSTDTRHNVLVLMFLLCILCWDLM